MPAAAPSTQSSRVWLTISMIVGTPRPSSPTSRAQAPSNSISLEALERLPSLSLSRWIWKRLRSPSGVQRGTRKQESPPSVCASTRKTSHIGAEQNHLCPVISYSAPGPPPFSGVARGGVGAHVGAALLLGHRHARRAPRLLRGRDEARVVVEREKPGLPLLGQLGLRAQRRHRRVGHRDRAAVRRPRPAASSMNSAARATWAPGRGSRQGSACRPCADAEPHQLVPGGVELHLVDAVAVAIVGAQHAAGTRWPGSPSAIDLRRAADARRTRVQRVLRPAGRPRAAAPRPGRGPARTGCSPASGADWLKTSWVAWPGRSSIVATGSFCASGAAARLGSAPWRTSTRASPRSRFSPGSGRRS